jgi:hypothetical protein
MPAIVLASSVRDGDDAMSAITGLISRAGVHCAATLRIQRKSHSVDKLPLIPFVTAANNYI